MSVATITETTQYLTFKLAEEIFALDVAKVREILDYSAVTKVPRTPDFMRGVINLRGSVVPVVDLRLKFGMSATEQTINTCIIVAEVGMADETILLGALRKSGWEAFEEIKRIDPEARTLLMSGYSQDLLQSRGLCACGAELLMKPFRPFDLARKVREVLDS